MSFTEEYSRYYKCCDCGKLFERYDDAKKHYHKKKKRINYMDRKFIK